MSLTARRARDWRAFFLLAREALLRGRPNLTECAVYMSIWLLPEDLRARLSRTFSNRAVHPRGVERAYSS